MSNRLATRIVLTTLIAAASGCVAHEQVSSEFGPLFVTEQVRHPSSVEFAFVASDGPRGGTEMFSIDAASGDLKETADEKGGSPWSVAIDATGKFLYATSSDSGLYAYRIDAANGTLSRVKGSPFYLPSPNYGGLAITNDDLLYASAANPHGVEGIYGFKIDESTGNVTAIHQRPIPGVDFSLVVQPQGHYLYGPSFVTGLSSAGVYGFSINEKTGALTPTPGSPYSSGYDYTGLGGAAIDPSGKFLYAATTTLIFAYKINASNGALSPVPGSPFAGSAKNLAISPDGKFLYGAGDYYGIYAYTIDATSGALTLVDGSPFGPVGGDPVDLAVDATNGFLYAAEFGPPSEVGGWTIDASSGALQPVTGSPFKANRTPIAIATCRFSNGACKSPPN
jgi:6-phosphogluconolactonase (cycloisomerase 2 family)